MTHKKSSVIHALAALLSFLLIFSLVGCEASQGPQGEQGEQGEQGLPGKDGTTLAIGENGNWILDGKDSGVLARGQNGSSLSIGENGNWILDGKDSGVPARGQNGSSLSIGENGNWYIDDKDTGYACAGASGAPGAPGTKVTIGENGNWFLDGVDSGISATGNGNGTNISLSEATAKVKASTVTVTVRTENGNGIGSGFVYDENGHICTNYHVIEGATFVQVILPDGTAREAEIVGYNEMADVAVIRVEPTGLVPATLGNSALLLAGDRVFAIGTPTALSYIASATYGHVSEPNRLLPDKDEQGNILKKMRVIQTDTPVNPGNSGGPLADAYGRIVGVVTMKLLVTHNGIDVENMGFALPINGVKLIVDDIIKNGKLTTENPIARGRTLIGMSGYGVQGGCWYYLDALTGKVAESETQKSGYHFTEKTGVYVSAVTGAAVLDKVQPGDIVMKVNGYALSHISELIELVNLREAGEEITLTLWHDGAAVTVTVTLVEEELT